MVNQAESQADREITLTRVFEAPRELVWKAWTELEHVAKWWGPQGFTTTTSKRELKPGGVWRYVMHGPDGRDYENVMTFIEVVAPERLTYKHGGAGDTASINFQVSVTFEKFGEDKTRLTMVSVFPSKDARDFVVQTYNAVEGGKQHLARLGEHLQTMAAAPGASSPPFVITRVFNVPPERMWTAWTERDQLQKWFGPKGVIMPHCTLYLKPGGTFHYCMRGPDGKDVWGKWTFREIAAPDRLEFVDSFSDEKGQTIPAFFDPDWPSEMHTVVTFAHHAGKGHGTVVRIQWTPFNATEAGQKKFDAAHSLIQQGWTGTLENLAEFLAK